MDPPSRRPLRRAAATTTAIAIAVVVAATSCSSDREVVSAPPFGSEAGAAPAVASSEPPSVTAPTFPVDRVAMVGDSITVMAKTALEEGLATLALDEVQIDGRSSRRMIVPGSIGSGLEAVEDIAASDPPDLWVVELGTNDVGNYRPEEYEPAIAELLAAIPADVPLVWVDTYLDPYPEAAAQFNDVLRAMLARRGTATVVDWASVAAADGSLTDGVHPSGFGVQELTERVVAAVDDWKA